MPLYPANDLYPTNTLFPGDPDDPIVEEISLELYESLGIWRIKDQDVAGQPLRDVAESIGGRLQPIEDIIRDSEDGDPGWSQVIDVDRAPAEWLPWTGQLNGVRLPPGLTEQAQRDYIKAAPSQRRGSPGAIRDAAKLSLTGTKTVHLVERHGSPYRLTVATNASETPDPARLLSDILLQKPAGIVLTVTSITGGDYQTLRDTHSDYNDVLATFASYSEVLVDPDK